MQKTACRDKPDARARGSGSSDLVTAAGVSSEDALAVGVTRAPLSFGPWSIEGGVRVAAEISQQELLDAVALTASDEGAVPIMAQCGVPFPAGAICSQHELSAIAGVASKTIASTEATSLKRHVMFLKEYYRVRT